MHTDELITENSTHRIVIDSVDYDGQPAIPATFIWDLHDPIDDTPLTTNNSEPPASSVTVVIAAQYNEIRHGRPYERRVLTVRTTFGANQEPLNDQHAYLIKNLLYVPPTP